LYKVIIGFLALFLWFSFQTFAATLIGSLPTYLILVLLIVMIVFAIFRPAR